MFPFESGEINRNHILKRFVCQFKEFGFYCEGIGSCQTVVSGMTLIDDR